MENFTITSFEPMKRYEFDMDSENMRGHWVGLFSYDHHKTSVHFTEDVTAKKRILKPLVGIKKAASCLYGRFKNSFRALTI